MHIQPAETNGRIVLTVRQLTLALKEVVESDIFSNLWISGEISNPSLSSSGHFFFSLKETGADRNESFLLKGAIWRTQVQTLAKIPADGDQVVCHGKLSLYGPSGEYRLIVDAVEYRGVGAFWLRFQQLREALQKEGLFDGGRKKPIPPFPRNVGIVTAETGAALRDILNIMKRRASQVDVLLFPVPVQGESAAPEIARAIAMANSLKGDEKPDVLIVGRGGGSIEDLWPFNEEEVARAIFASSIPVISAVGHEVDYTIADFVADLRAPTPSAAAELVIRDRLEIRGDIQAGIERMERIMTLRFARLRELTDPILLSRRLSRLVESKCTTARMRHDAASGNLNRAMEQKLAGHRGVLDNFTRLLGGLSPDAVLRRGYAIVFDAAGNLVKSSAAMNEGTEGKIRMHDGERKVTFGESAGE